MSKEGLVSEEIKRIKLSDNVKLLVEHQKELYQRSLKEHRRIMMIIIIILGIFLGAVAYYAIANNAQYKHQIMKLQQEYDQKKQDIIDTAFYIKDNLIGDYYIDDRKKYEDFMLIGTKTIVQLYEANKTPRKNRMDKRIIKEYLDITYRGSSLVGIDPYLLLAIDYIESEYIYNAISPAGARGICQFMPITAKLLANSHTNYEILQVDSYELQKLFNPIYSKKLQIRYMKYLLDTYNGRVEWALLAYNWGPSIVTRKWWNNGEITFNELPAEQQEYADKVLTRYHIIKGNARNNNS